ncbi:SUMF1/EgtB/PvdO family nonheme iron enzyme [Mesorhizobium sp. YM1C-6-2]|uniref:SUMF1/EgtB/PvdO family nonheme iron enzyme n=1 Tax=Mesorhizobium sp. YM1C-6-2 TaxID=1827501 RepID=UPI000EF1A6A9|nr:SUMF1/EgtB/PvdO family nonheme iron enzyme [Mesorhizobium sp. YM1C-6-2]RLP27093.1 formylglycine-generating enzyme family protein [Mesorhizobium sp. YM1C-6-2]
MAITLLEASFTSAALVAPALALGLQAPSEPPVPAAETVTIAEQVLDFPLPGEFLADGRPAAAPTTREDVAAFRITKHQVSLADYQRCAAAGACAAADARATHGDVPVTGVNWTDAQAYARWYSEVTDGKWRLPTALEAAAAAGERFGGESFAAGADDPGNPAVRWIRRYREEAAAKRPADPEPKPRGHYGPNSFGVEDFGGNVWEWTSTCYSRVTLTAEGGVESAVENCGVHVLEGRHRAYMSNFVRDGKSGGCAVGTPPENLGFRLVRDDGGLPAIAALKARLRSVIDMFRYS